MASVGLAAPPSPQITGGTPAQRTLLRQVVRAQATSQIVKLTIAPANPSWQPERPGEVQLTAELAGAGKRARDNNLGDWETWMVGGAFRDRSAALGLPRVIVVGDNEGAQRATGGPHPARRPMSGLPGFRRRVAAVAARSGARIVAVRVGDPDGYSALVALQVADPVPFLRHRLGPLELRLQDLHADGTFIVVFERAGRLLSSEGGSLRLSSGLGGGGDPRYRSCLPFLTTGPLTLAPPLPCPSDWRPPPSTPPRPPKITGDESGGALAAGGSDGDGATVPYRPGTTGGLGIVLENPNGHPITVESIAPSGSPGGPIRFLGVRIQVPRSRSDPGGAAELHKPYGPEPPMQPVTIRPGDWIGVGLHFRVFAGVHGRPRRPQVHRRPHIPGHIRSRGPHGAACAPRSGPERHLPAVSAARRVSRRPGDSTRPGTARPGLAPPRAGARPAGRAGARARAASSCPDSAPGRSRSCGRSTRAGSPRPG